VDVDVPHEAKTLVSYPSGGSPDGAERLIYKELANILGALHCDLRQRKTKP